MCYGALQTPGQGTGQSPGVPWAVGRLRAGEDGLPGELPRLRREGPVCAREDTTPPGSSHMSAIICGPSLQKCVAPWWDYVPPTRNVAWGHPKNISKQNVDRVRWLQVADGLSDKTQHSTPAEPQSACDEPLPEGGGQGNGPTEHGRKGMNKTGVTSGTGHWLLKRQRKTTARAEGEMLEKPMEPLDRERRVSLATRTPPWDGPRQASHSGRDGHTRSRGDFATNGRTGAQVTAAIMAQLPRVDELYKPPGPTS